MNALCRASSATLPNAGCSCVGTGESTLWCRRDTSHATTIVRHWCEAQCTCGDDTVIPPDSLPTDEWEEGVTFDQQVVPLSPWDPDFVGHTCKTTCSSIERQCSWPGERKRWAPKVSIFFWMTGSRGPTKSVAEGMVQSSLAGKRKNKVKRQDASMLPKTTVTAFPARSPAASTISASTSVSSAAEPAATAKWEYQAQLIIDDLMPAPCNSSHVSYACANSTDGIVYEPSENWLGAIIPENATEVAPVPQEWLSLNGLPASFDDPSTWTASDERDIEVARERIKRKFR